MTHPLIEGEPGGVELPANVTVEPVAPFDARTGEVLEHIDTLPPDVLCEVLDSIHTYQATLKEAAGQIEQELRRRLDFHQRKHMQFDAWEVDTRSTRTRKWDPDELDGVLAALVEDGTIKASETADIVVLEPKVSGKAALALRGRLSGDALAALDTAWEWQERKGQLTIRPLTGPAGEVCAEVPPDQLAGNGPGPGGTSADPTPPLTPEELFG